MTKVDERPVTYSMNAIMACACAIQTSLDSINKDEVPSIFEQEEITNEGGSDNKQSAVSQNADIEADTVLKNSTTVAATRRTSAFNNLTKSY